MHQDHAVLIKHDDIARFACSFKFDSYWAESLQTITKLSSKSLFLGYKYSVLKERIAFESLSV